MSLFNKIKTPFYLLFHPEHPACGCKSSKNLGQSALKAKRDMPIIVKSKIMGSRLAVCPQSASFQISSFGL